MADSDNDAGGVGAGNEGSLQAWFVPECEAREAALAALAGKEHYERFEALNRASQIFGKNGTDFRDHPRQVHRHRPTRRPTRRGVLARNGAPTAQLPCGSRAPTMTTHTAQ